MVTKKKAKVEKGKKAGLIAKPFSVPAIPFQQNGHQLFIFCAKASTLYKMLSINRRAENKDEGYQRTLSLSRTAAIAKHILKKKPIPGCIIVSIEGATFKAGMFSVPKGTDIGWVIDGQHRLAGAHEAAQAGVDIELPVVAFIDLGVAQQVEQFVTINREAKGVPSSLYLDLLGALPNKNPAESAKERAADIATLLRTDEESPFFERIVVTTSPKEGQVSLVNFVRKVAPHLLPDKGILHIYTQKEQQAVVSNYFEALRIVFPSEYTGKDSIFFKTVGFGGLWNAFPTLFSLTLTQHGGFQVKDAVKVLKEISGFNFSGWKELGSGNLAETMAGEDLKTGLHLAFQVEGKPGSSLKV